MSFPTLGDSVSKQCASQVNSHLSTSVRSLRPLSSRTPTKELGTYNLPFPIVQTLLDGTHVMRRRPTMPRCEKNATSPVNNRGGQHLSRNWQIHNGARGPETWTTVCSLEDFLANETAQDTQCPWFETSMASGCLGRFRTTWKWILRK